MQMENNFSSTKQKIIEVAIDLFGSKGIESTSVRDIARITGVNLAAVNYHFGSKESLITQALEISHRGLESRIEEVYLRSEHSLGPFLVEIFRLLIETPEKFLNAYRFYLSGKGEHQVDYQLAVDSPPIPGPPGMKYLAMSLEKSVGRSISMKDQLWAIRVLFSHVIQTAVTYCSPCAKHPQFQEVYPLDQLESGIIRLTEIVTRELSTH